MNFYDLLKDIILSSTIVYLTTIYKNDIKNIFNKIINRFDLAERKIEIEEFIVLKVYFEDQIKSIIEEFIVSKINPLIETPNEDLSSIGLLEKLRTEFIDYVLTYVETDAMIQKYINIVYKDVSGFHYYLFLLFDTEIYQKIIEPELSSIPKFNT